MKKVLADAIATREKNPSEAGMDSLIKLREEYADLLQQSGDKEGAQKQQAIVDAALAAQLSKPIPADLRHYLCSLACDFAQRRLPDPSSATFPDDIDRFHVERKAGKDHYAVVGNCSATNKFGGRQRVGFAVEFALDGKDWVTCGTDGGILLFWN